MDSLRLPAATEDATAGLIHELRFQLAWLEKRWHALTLELAELLDDVDLVDAPTLDVVQPGTAVESQPPLRVADLAAALRRTKSATYRLLEGGAIPGAFKVHPDLVGSRWYIPADAANRFAERGEKS